MTRELDAGIATLLGWTDAGSGWWWTPAQGIRIPHYSSDLNVLMSLIRERWPKARCLLDPAGTFLWPKGYGISLFYHGKGATDTERLANAVVAALRAEAKP